VNIWAWIILFVCGVGLTALDVFVLNRKPRVQTPSTALAWFCGYLLVAVSFNVVVYAAYSNHWLGLGMVKGVEARDGPNASLEFISALLLDLTLDLDMVFVFSAVFAHFKTPPEFQRRILIYGTVVTQLVQGPLILGIGFLLNFQYTRVPLQFILSGLLVLAALRMIVMRRETLDPSENPLYALLKRFVPVSEKHAGDSLLTREKGRMAFTPLAFTLLVLTTAELIFSMDSIPATFAVTSDPAIIFAANGLGLLCMRSLYFAIKDSTPSLRYMKVGLALTLCHCAIAISLPQSHRLPPEIFLIVIASTAALGLGLATYYRTPKDSPDAVPEVSPLGEDADRFARLTLKQGRKIFVFMVGVTVVIIGIIMIAAPGPAVIVIPAGLALLATEFVWARRLLERYKRNAADFTKRAGDMIVKTPRPGLILPVFLTVGATVLGSMYLWPAKLVLLAASPIFGFLGVWSITTLRKTWELRQARKGAERPPEADSSGDQAAWRSQGR
jgi:tellurite resistance protein TerC